MNRFIYIFFLTVISNFSFSQETYKVIYKSYPNNGPVEKTEMVTQSKLKYLYQDLDEAILSLRFELLVNSDKVSFKTNDIIFHNQRALRLARTFTNSSEEYYFDLQNKTNFIKKSFLNEEFYIENNEVMEWIVTEETKQIDSLTCYKATTTRSFKIKNEIKQVAIEAWFCPSLSIPYGPKGFYALPGLIVQISDDKTTMVVEKISKENIQIQFPQVKKIMSKVEFDNLVDKKKEDFLENKKNEKSFGY
ncbi:GLPGLI family protein [Flavobacterium sp. J27]|uniref:GLPGLI family protein n=1 Tax=Flavobacterium sp. J27 TaxID=2060419 RepID=UPI0010319F74|nr:GLPGLI family protein [Flavobacterium sp. J27]